MTVDRAIQLLKVEQLYCLRQTGFQQQQINKEIAKALDIAIKLLEKEKEKCTSIQ